MKERGLYVHIPFCASKCAYCDFYSIPQASFASASGLYEKYISALCMHMSAVSDKFSDTVFGSVYIGGGTPSILSSELLGSLLNDIRESFNVDKDAEFTLEANPATLTDEKLTKITDGGINRLSLGCQSAIDSELKRLSRLHTFEQFRESFLMARAHGISNISVDLMYGLPDQSIDSLLFSIDEVASLSPEHISLYGLRVEPDTPFGKEKDLFLPSDDNQCEMYKNALEKLSYYGYSRYEISNFSKEGFHSRHNLRYWECGEYLGLGPAAHSYIDGVRYGYSRDISAYIYTLERGGIPLPSEYTVLTPEDRLEEFIMLSLRLERGLSVSSLADRFGQAAAKSFIGKIQRYVPKFILNDGDTVRFTTDGFLVSNTILAELI